MRRKDRQITDEAVLTEILNRNSVLHLALCDGERPYIVSLNYGSADGALYFHSALEGRKIDLLRKNPKVCFTVVDSQHLDPGDRAVKCTTRYTSLVAEGTASFLEDSDAKIEALQILMAQHTGRSDWELPAAVVAKTAVVRVDIETLTGKQS